MNTLASILVKLEYVRKNDSVEPRIVEEDLLTSILLPYTYKIVEGDPGEEENTSEFADDSIFVRLPVQIYLSPSGVSLIKKTMEVREPDSTKSFNVEEEPLFSIFIETKKEEKPGDILSGFYKRLVFNKKYVRKYSTANEIQQAVFTHTEDIKQILIAALDFENEEEYKDWIKEELTGVTDEDLIDATFVNTTLAMLDVVEFIIEGINKELQQKALQIPEKIWNSKKRDEDVEAFIHDFSVVLREKIAGALEVIETISDFRPPEFIATLPGNLGKMFEDINTVINGLVDSLRAIASFAKENLLNPKDMFDTLVGFFSGVWNAVMDIIAGFFALAQLFVAGFKSLLKIEEDISAFLGLLAEFIDELVQAVANVNWIEVLLHLFKKVVPLLVEFLTETIPEWIENAEARLNDVSQFSYDLGYVVAEIAENFLPPLKAVRVGRVSAGLFTKALKTTS